MMPKYLFGLLMVLAFCLLRVASRPSANETPNLSEDESATKFARAISDRVDGPVYYQADTETNVNDDSTVGIVEKIKAINSGLSKPKKEQVNFNLPYNEKSQGIDQELLEKIKHIIASGKLHSNSFDNRQEDNFINGDPQSPNSRALKMTPDIFGGNEIQMMPFPYVMNMPVIVTPSTEMLSRFETNNKFKTMMSNDAHQTRQQQPSFPGFPFFQNLQFDWPITQNLFPVLIKNPFLGGWNNFIEYGQSADVCSRKQKSKNYINYFNKKEADEEDNDVNENSNVGFASEIRRDARESRALKKRTISNTAPDQDIESNKLSRKVYVASKRPTRKTTKKPTYVEQTEDSKNDNSDETLRIPFGDFNWFKDKKQGEPTPGFFINRLRVRKGGVAIAGPGGVATAGRGGTAIVGPGGLAYTQPGGLAIAGPEARVVALPEGTDINSVLSSLQQNDSSKSTALQPIREGKLVATGPVIYYHPTEHDATQYIPFYGGAKGQYLEVKKDTRGAVLSEKVVAEESISSENIAKNNDESLLSKVLAANLKNVRTLSNSLLKLHNMARKSGSLGAQEKTKFKTELFALGEAASSTIKLIDEIADDIDGLFKRNTTLLRKYQDDYDDDVGEEGIGIDSPDDSEGDNFSKKTLIAEAKPVGLAVVGESGLAAARPMATAVAISGVAIARPVGTAIAGIDPSLLGIEFHVNQGRRLRFKGMTY